MEAGIYKHYKGGFYQVLGVARHSETDEAMVVYVALDPTKPGPRLCVRPLSGPEGFTTGVRKPGLGSTLVIPRFEHIGDSCK